MKWAHIRASAIFHTFNSFRCNGFEPKILHSLISLIKNGDWFIRCFMRNILFIQIINGVQGGSSINENQDSFGMLDRLQCKQKFLSDRQHNLWQSFPGLWINLSWNWNAPKILKSEPPYYIRVCESIRLICIHYQTTHVQNFKNLHWIRSKFL